MKSISVIVPAYNMDKHIEACINSILSSTNVKIEIILVLGISNDTTNMIANKLALSYENIHICYCDENNPGKMRNLGLSIVLTEYVSFIDCDDFIEPNMYETMLNKTADIINCDYKLLDLGTNNCQLFHFNDIFLSKFDSLYSLNSFAFGTINGEIWNKIYRKNFLVQNKIQFDSTNGIYGEDLYFNWQCIVKGATLNIINQALYIHTIRADSITNSNKKKNFTRRFTYILTQLYNDIKESKNYIQPFSQIMCSLLIDNIINAKNNKIEENIHDVLNRYREQSFFKPSLKSLLKDKHSSIKRKLLIIVIYLRLDFLLNILF